jgi:DNA-directed RNA polymerase subunit RPC12/RpoP
MRRTSAVTAAIFSIEHQCPQCGAPVSLEETDRLFACPYCRVRRFLYTAGYFRYFLSPLVSLEKDVFYIPYWRCKGLKITILDSITKREIVDRSLCALTGAVKAPALGVRSQTLRMKFIGPAPSGNFLTPTMAIRDFMESVENSPDMSPLLPFSHCASDIQTALMLADALTRYGQEKVETHNEALGIFIGETVSLIYVPYFIKTSVLYDGITGRAVGPAGDTGLGDFKDQEDPEAGKNGFQKAMFIPALCPKCGMDLQGEKESCMLVCTQCQCAWAPNEQGLVAEEFFVTGTTGKADQWVPFWSISVGCANASLSSVADFYRLAGIPRPILPAHEERPFHFWVPAFKSNPELFIRLGKSFTMQQSPIEKPVVTLTRVAPVTLPAREAFQSIPVFFAEMAPARKKILPIIRTLQLSLRKSNLVFVPFADRGAELVQPQCNMAINKNALRAGV